MKKFFLAVLFSILGLGAPAIANEKWDVDPAHTTARFKISHMTISKVSGEITGAKGQFTLDPADLTKTTMNVSLDAKSVNTSNAKRDDHLKNSDFFDVKKFPTMTFKSKKVEGVSGNTFTLIGDLTLHGITREVKLENATLTEPVKDPFGPGMKRGFTAKTTINRKDFGMTWNKAMDGGGWIVGETAEVEVEAELNSTATGKPTKG